MSINTVTNRIGPYIDNGNGTVTDTHTGLTWMRCALGQVWDGTTCTGEAGAHRFNRAMALQINFADCSDWRVPNVDELESIVDPNRTEPAINTDAFPNTRHAGAYLRPAFWTSSVDSGSPNRANIIFFDNGGVSSSEMDDSHHVRLVRGEVFVAKNRFIDGVDESVSTKHVMTPSASDQQSDIASTVKMLMKRIDRMERRFDASIEKIEKAIESLPTEERIEKAVKTLSSGQLAAMSHTTKWVDLRADESIRLLDTVLTELRRLGVHELPSQHGAASPKESVDSPTSISTITGVVDFAALLTQLVGMESISLAALRTLILPLGLMPNAVIDDINERALDLLGEPALKESEDEIIVFRDVLAEVVAQWDIPKK